MTATAIVLAPGETLGGYRILEVIGIGGMAIVYRAEQLSLGRQVALKVLAPAIALDEPFRERFRREGKHVAALDHPNIVAIHDSGEIDDHLFLAMRLVRGATLAERMRAEGLTAEQTISVLAPIADALDAAHAVGLVHRDVKPQNILIGDNGHPYLADFGVAKGPATAGASTTGGFIGTYNYAAPEQILDKEITSATDVYGLTAVLYQCFAGQLPFLRSTDAGVLHAHVYEPPPRVDSHQPGGKRFNELIARGLAKQPGRRYATASALMRAAVAVVDELPAERLVASPTFVVAPSRQNGGAQVGLRNGAPSAKASSDATTVGPARSVAPAPAEPRVLWRRRRLMAAAALATVLVIAAAAAVALSGPGSSAARVSVTAASLPFTVTYAHPWRLLRSAVTGTFALRRGARTGPPIALASRYGTLAAGQLASSASIPGDVPPALGDRYGRPMSSTNAVVAGHPGREYTWSPSGGSLVAYVLPTVSGDSAVICESPAATDLQSCGALARGARVSTDTVLAPGVDRTLAVGIRSALKPVDTIRSGLKGLRGATLPARAAKASAVSRAESGAVKSLKTLKPPLRYGRALAPLTAALDAEAAAFSSLARAARNDDRTAYAKAVTRVFAVSRGFESATRGLAAYRLGVVRLGRLQLAAPPPTPVSSTTTPATATTTTTTTTPTLQPSSSPTITNPGTTTVPLPR